MLSIRQLAEKEFARTVFVSLESFIVEWQENNPAKTFRLGITGGSSVQDLYVLLGASQIIDWQRVCVIVTDERRVSIDDEHSTMRMITETLLAAGNVPIDNLIYFSGEPDCNLEDSVLVVAEELEALLQARTPLFDVLLLGVGTDGHVASVFPGSVADHLDATTLAASTYTDTFVVKERMTVTLAGLQKADEVWFLLRGVQKAPVLALLEDTEAHDLPVQKLRDAVTSSQVWYGV